MQGESWTAYTSTFVKPKPFLRVLVRAVENAGRKWYQGVIHNCDFNFDEILEA